MARPHQKVHAWQEAISFTKMTHLVTQTIIASDLGFLLSQHGMFAELERVGKLLMGYIITLRSFSALRFTIYDWRFTVIYHSPFVSV